MARITHSDLGSCEAVWKLLLKKQAVALTPEEGIFFAQHLLGCKSCRYLAETIEGITFGMGALGRTEFTPRPELRNAVLARVRALKN